ncbi:MAG: CotH kinase family protein [Deltaproteobacteria bacterium]|nr:CotH kinase family protein [Deltaproteobacteria bacterium]
MYKHRYNFNEKGATRYGINASYRHTMVLWIVSAWMMGAHCTENEQIPFGCGEIDPSLSTMDASALFDAPGVPTFDLYLPPGEWETLKQNARNEEYVSANACFKGRAIGEVGMRFKGNVGSLEMCFDENNQLICPKLDIKLKFDKYDEKRRFMGLKRLSFNTSGGDASYIKEPLVYDVYREMNIVTPRTGWANLRVNGKSQGLYILIEPVDGRFTEDRWPDDPDGNLYKEQWPLSFKENGSTVMDVDRAVSKLKTNEADANVAGLLKFSTSFMAAAPEDWKTLLDDTMGFDYLSRYMAVDDLIANVDGVTAWYYEGDEKKTAFNHNFYIYEKSDGKLVLIPWDLDTTFFSRMPFFSDVPTWRNVPENCDARFSAWNGNKTIIASGCDRIFQTLTQDMAPYENARKQLLTGGGPFTQGALQAKIDKYAARIRNAAGADPLGPGQTSFENAVKMLKLNIPMMQKRNECLDEAAVPAAEVSVSKVADMEDLTTCSLLNGAKVYPSSSTFLSDTISTDASISGNRNLTLTFEFSSDEYPWSSWLSYELLVSERPYNIQQFTGMRLKISADPPRPVRLYLAGNENADLGFSPIAFGWDLKPTRVVQQMEVRFADAALPDWAIATGESPSNSLQEVLTGLHGIVFSPASTEVNGHGILPKDVVDTGSVQIDDIEFF